MRSVSDRLLSSSVGVESPLVSRELLEHVITIMAFTSLILVSPYCPGPLTHPAVINKEIIFSQKADSYKISRTKDTKIEQGLRCH